MIHGTYMLGLLLTLSLSLTSSAQNITDDAYFYGESPPVGPSRMSLPGCYPWAPFSHCCSTGHRLWRLGICLPESKDIHGEAHAARKDKLDSRHRREQFLLRQHSSHHASWFSGILCLGCWQWFGKKRVPVPASVLIEIEMNRLRQQLAKRSPCWSQVLFTCILQCPVQY